MRLQTTTLALLLILTTLGAVSQPGAAICRTVAPVDVCVAEFADDPEQECGVPFSVGLGGSDLIGIYDCSSPCYWILVTGACGTDVPSIPDVPPLPELCTPNDPCIRIDPENPIQSVSPTGFAGSSSPVVTVGGVKITFTTGHFTTAVLAAPEDGDPCSTVQGKPGIAACEDNPVVPRTTYYPVSSQVAVACLQDAYLSIDVDGDGVDESGGPAYTVTSGPCP